MNIEMGEVPPAMVRAFQKDLFMSNILKPDMSQTKASTLLVAASTIVATSALALDHDDHGATVRIVEQALGKFSPDEVDSFTRWGADPATAARIVFAALETEASDVDDGATVGPSASITPVLASDAAQADLGAIPKIEMLIMIKEIVLPMAERLITEQVAMSTRLARLEASVTALSG